MVTSTFYSSHRFGGKCVLRLGLTPIKVSPRAEDTMTHCKKHPKYKGIHKPRTGCIACWAFFLGMAQYCLNAGCECLDYDNKEAE